MRERGAGGGTPGIRGRRGSAVPLSAWVVGSALRDLLMRARPESSPVGLAVAAASTLVMPWIVSTKRRVAESIGSAALRADAACGVTCAYMAGTLLAGLGLRAVFGWWWADPLAALGIVYFVVREGPGSCHGSPGPRGPPPPGRSALVPEVVRDRAAVTPRLSPPDLPHVLTSRSREKPFGHWPVMRSVEHIHGAAKTR